MGLYEKILRSKVGYNQRVISNLIKSNRNKYGEVRPKTKYLIFFMMKKIILKGVNQFFMTNESRSNDTPYEKDDIVAEIYLVFQKCIEGYNVDMDKNFYLYFNTAVSRRMSRMCNYKSTYNPNHKKTSYDIVYGNADDGTPITMKDFIPNKAPEISGSVDITNPKDIFFLGFDEMDHAIMMCLYNKESRDVMVEETGLSRREIKIRIERIKIELKERYYDAT